MSKINMTRAFDASGNIVSISDVKNGLKCNCFCIDCGTVLIAKNNKNSEKSHHFAHIAAGDNNVRECHWSPETETHIMAKEIILEDKMLEVPLGTINPKIMQIRFDEVYLEVRGENRIPDIIGYIEGEAIYIEIAVTHFCDIEKIVELKKLNKSCIEIDLSNFNITTDVISKNDLRAALKLAEKKWLSVAPCGDFAIKMHNHNRAEMKKANEEYKAVKNNYQKEIMNLKSNIEILNQKCDLASERVAPIVAELSEKQEKLRSLNSQLNNLLPVVKLNEGKINDIKNYKIIKENLVEEIRSLQHQVNQAKFEIKELQDVIESESDKIQKITSQSGFTSENLTLMESKLKTKEDVLNFRESVFSEKSLKINNEIEVKAQKIAESRFEKLCAEKDQIIKGKEKKLEDIENEIKHLKLKYGSYIKFKS